MARSILNYKYFICHCWVLLGCCREVWYVYVCSLIHQYSSSFFPPGCPRIIRTDRGTENARVAYLQPFLRRHGHSFQYGRSASNQVWYTPHHTWYISKCCLWSVIQRIDAWWSQLRRWFMDWWIDFFEVHNLPFTLVMGPKYNLPLSHLSLLGFERE